jgi:Domain of unknown function (DUF4174)
MLAQSKNTMEKYRWENRIVLIFSPSEKNEAYRQQLSSLVEGEKGIEERDIVIFKIFEDKGITPENEQLTKNICEQLRQEFGIKKEQFCVILIGKDGGEKYRKSTILSNENLFAIIDAMPMRRTEMKKN